MNKIFLCLILSVNFLNGFSTIPENVAPSVSVKNKSGQDLWVRSVCIHGVLGSSRSAWFKVKNKEEQLFVAEPLDKYQIILWKIGDKPKDGYKRVCKFRDNETKEDFYNFPINGWTYSYGDKVTILSVHVGGTAKASDIL